MPKRASFLSFLVLCALWATSEASAQGQPLYWSYAVKFVCGLQGPFQPGEPPVKPGNYATEINIHNPHYQPVEVRKKVLVLVDRGQPIGREPQQQGPRAYDGIVLGPDFATYDDCNKLWTLVYPPPMPIPTPMPPMIGFLVVISKEQLDIDAVYTAATGASFATAAKGVGGIAIDVERVEGKQVAIAPGLFPGGPDIENPIQPERRW